MEKRLHLADFKGKALLITFVYTRCPFATFCPLTSSKFAAIQKELANTPGDYEKTHLITISPILSTTRPQSWGSMVSLTSPTIPRVWTLGICLTRPDDLRKLATAFGLEYFEQDNLICTQ